MCGVWIAVDIKIVEFNPASPFQVRRRVSFFSQRHNNGIIPAWLWIWWWLWRSWLWQQQSFRLKVGDPVKGNPGIILHHRRDSSSGNATCAREQSGCILWNPFYWSVPFLSLHRHEWFKLGKVRLLIYVPCITQHKNGSYRYALRAEIIIIGKEMLSLLLQILFLLLIYNTAKTWATTQWCRSGHLS